MQTGFLGASAVKNLPAMQETQEITGSVLGLGKAPGGRNGNPLQYSCWRGAWQVTVLGWQRGGHD